MNEVIEKRLRYHHLCHRVISYVAILATLGLSGLLLAVIRPATSHAARPSEIRYDTIVVQTVSPASNSTEMPRPAHTPTFIPTPQQHQAVVLYDTFVSVWQNPVGTERAGVTTLKSKTLVYVCDAASDSVTLRYQVSLGPCDTTEPIGWMNSNTISPPIPPWPETRVTSFPTPTLTPQPTRTPPATSAPSSGDVLQSNKVLLVGAVLLVLAGLGYLFWKIVSAPANTEIYVRRGPSQNASGDVGQSDLQPAYLAEARRRITERLDIEDLRTLCFDLGVDYDRLRGEGKGGKARELVALMARQQRLPELMKEIERLIQEGASGKANRNEGDAGHDSVRPEDSSR